MEPRLSFAHASIELGEGTFSESTFSGRLGGFIPRGPRGSSLELRLSRARSDAGVWTPFAAFMRIEGGFRVTPDEIELHPSVNDLGALLALRILFAKAIEAKRGILVHASCVELEGRAALATGVSGAGKSTLARWAQQAGATLLSDEVVGLLPNGRVLGTPFFSDRDLIGSPTEATLSVAMTLKHGDVDSFSDGPTHGLVQALCEQAFRRDSGVEARDALVCIVQALSGVRTGAYTCRNAPSSGSELLKLLSA